MMRPQRFVSRGRTVPPREMLVDGLTIVQIAFAVERTSVTVRPGAIFVTGPRFAKRTKARVPSGPRLALWT
jgi:hypothetical protein